MGGGKAISQILIWFGQNSLCLMLVHQLIMAILDNYVEPYINNDHIYMTIQFLCTILISILIANLIKKRIPILIGK